MPRPGVRSILARSSLLLLTAALLMALFPSTASAIPAWSRKYGVPCSTCHYPAPPRLSAYGHKFRRAQYRLPEEFGKEADWKSLGNYVAMRIRGGYQYDSPETGFPGGGGHTSSFKLNDATLFFAGPVSKNFSGFVELERPGDEEIIEAVVSIGGIRGKPDSFWTFRLGQFHTLTRVGFGGLDRPTGITTPLALSRSLTANDDFKLNQDQVGVEGTYVHQNWRVIGQVLNGANWFAGAGGATTTDQADQNRDKDLVLAYELMWGKTASGLSVFGYDGKQDNLATTPVVAPGAVKVKRFGVTAAQVWDGGLEVQGGYVTARDDYDLTLGGVDKIDGMGYWLEVEKHFSKVHDLTIFGRWDSVDPDTDVSHNTRTQATVGLVLPIQDWHARWALELRDIKQDTTTPDSFKDKQAAIELMLNF